ncbi:MAG: aldo/keto reductase [Alphaproteobacteria bacterium]|nr:aldo/keto reductase [Alphaproteobacteria bacterium]
MQSRKLGSFDVSAIGLGCMSLSHAYGTPPEPAAAAELLLKALDSGYSFFDTASLYGQGGNETLLGNTLKHRRGEFVLASKCGMLRPREPDGRPEILKRTCDDSLRRLQTDVIDLYYLHRWDKRVPIEDSVGALADLVKQGKIRMIGLSEVSAVTLREAHAVHPIAAVQSEYSLWTRNPEIAVLDACRDIGATFVAFSPLARGFLTGSLRDVTSLPPKDIRHAMPRFQGDNFTRNLKLLNGFAALARETDCTMGQLALAWLLAKAPHVVPIPGTTRVDHLAENAAAADVRLTPAAIERMELLINAQTVSGPRYNATTLPEIDTESD